MLNLWGGNGAAPETKRKFHMSKSKRNTPKATPAEVEVLQKLAEELSANPELAEAYDKALAEPAPEVVAPTGPTLFTITPAGLQSAGRTTMQTRQRSAAGHGKEWRQKGKTDNSLRAAALCAILDKAEGALFTRDEAVAALGTINLGSKTPASRWSAFNRAGLIAPVAK